MKDRERELEIVREMNSCIHFTGIHRDVCAAGVEYRSLVGGPDLGWAARIPCILTGLTKEPRATCELKKLPTREEATAEVDRSNERILQCLVAMDAAHTHAEKQGFRCGNGGAGEMECPICKGRLRYTVAGVNGHMHAACVTEGCVRWME